MMGVVDGYRNAGGGRLLKFRQRELALAAGINLIEWTFDPLETKNAYFNIERLGAVVSRYVLNQYGNTSSKLHAGLPTDRCIAEWFLDKEKTPVEITARIEVPYEGARTREVQARISQQFLEHFRAGRTVVRFERGETHGVYLLADKDGLQ
jgi:predicted GNAT superfamily acetyltransferase